MQIKIFTIPLINSTEAEAEMNKFLRTHRIISVSEELTSSQNISYWSFLIKYHTGSTQEKTENKNERVDYKEVLAPEEYSKYLILHSIRKVISKQEGLPVYNIFLNKELAEMAKLSEITYDNIKQTKGIGENRLKKYGELIVNKYIEDTQ